MSLQDYINSLKTKRAPEPECAWNKPSESVGEDLQEEDDGIEYGESFDG